MPARIDKIRVLIVDDHMLFRESVARLLEAEHDLEVRHCGSVRESLAIMADWPANVVLLDFDLGNEKGSSFLAQAHAAGFHGKTQLEDTFVQQPFKIIIGADPNTGAGKSLNLCPYILIADGFYRPFCIC